MTDIDTIRERVCQHIHNGYTDSAFFGNDDIVWVEGYGEWLLVATDKDGTRFWRGPENNAAHLLNYISDDDVRNFYEENLAEEYSDEETA